MPLTFITGSQDKYRELQAVFPELQHLDLQLEEIQSLDPRAVIHHKLIQALEHHSAPLLVEDTSLTIVEWGGLPGPLVKWFITSLGASGLAELATLSGTQKASAVAETTIGYAASATEIKFFSGQVSGEIVLPRGQAGFGWDSIFQPEGSKLSFGEMSLHQKQQWSMRQKAAAALAKFLEEKR